MIMQNQTKYMYSDQNRTLEQWNQELVVIYLPLTIIHVLYIIIGVTGNSIVLFIYLKKFKANSDGRFFIPVLAVIDMIACILNSTFHVSETLLPVMFESDIRCKIAWFSGMTAAEASIFTLLIIAIDRYMKICRPFGRQLSLRAKKLSILSVVLISLTLSAPCFVFYGLAEVESKDNLIGWVCTSVTNGMPELSMAFNVFILGITAVESVVISILYFLICRVIFKQQKRIKNIKNKVIKENSEEQRSVENKGSCPSISTHASNPLTEKLRKEPVFTTKELDNCSVTPAMKLDRYIVATSVKQSKVASEELYESGIMESTSESSIAETFQNRANDVSDEHAIDLTIADSSNCLSEMSRNQSNNAAEECDSGLNVSIVNWSRSTIETSENQVNLTTEKKMTALTLSVEDLSHSSVEKIQNQIIDEDDESGIAISEQRSEMKLSTIHEKLKDTGHKTMSPVHVNTDNRKVQCTRITLMFIVITIVFAISYLPKTLLMFIDSASSTFLVTHPDMDYFIRFLHSIYIFNNFVNPFIYGVMDNKFKAELRNLCRGRK